MTNSFADFSKAKMILAIGSNMTEAHPVAAAAVKRAVLNGAELYVVDPRRTEFAEKATQHIPLKVGSDIALLNGLMHVLITEDLYDKNYVKTCCTGFEELEKKVMEYPPERAAEITGLDAETIRQTGQASGRGQTGHADVHPGNHRTYLRSQQCPQLCQSPDAPGQCGL